MHPRRKQFICEKVRSLLAESGIKHPKVQPQSIAQRYNIDIRIEPIDGDISGFLLRQIGVAGAIIGLNRDQSTTRQRFTLAHELGHFFLHNNQDGELHIDRTSRFVVQLRDAKSSTGASDDEREANFFAAELLMPAAFLSDDVAGYGGLDLGDEQDVISKLASRYGVSTQAMSYRLSNLGFAIGASF